MNIQSLAHTSAFSLKSQLATMKFIFLLCITISVTMGFAVGQYFNKREVFIARFTDTIPKIVVTEMLLNEYLKNCDKSGYRRFASFHEHNIDRLLREIEYSESHPYFLESNFVDEITTLFYAHKSQHDTIKKDFSENCGDV